VIGAAGRGRRSLTPDQRASDGAPTMASVNRANRQRSARIGWRLVIAPLLLHHLV